MRWARHVAWIGEKRGAYGVIVGKPEGRPRHRWEDNIRMDLKETRWWTWPGLIWIRTSGRLL